MLEALRPRAARLLPWIAAAAIGASFSAEAAALHRTQAVRPHVETIAFFAGPCHDGGCAVYHVAVRSNGVVTFQGLAHTSAMGVSTRTIGRPAYDQFAASLSPYRPRGPGVESACLSRAPNEPTYRITWSGSRRSPATLEHSLGCSSPRDLVLNAILTSAPAQLGIEDLTAIQQSPASVIKPHIFYF